MYVLWQMQRKIANFANSATDQTMEVPTSLFANIFSAVNEADKLRWVCIAPFGDWDNKQGMQRFQKDDAEKIINEFNSVLHTPQRILGAPWYIGHPDHPAFTDKYKDTKAYGRIKSLEARQDGLYAGVRFGQDGEKLIADEAFHGHSVNWYLKQDAKNPKVWRPFRLKSVGFTNEPNIPVPTLTTANENESMVANTDWLKGTALRREHMAKLRMFANQERQMKANETKTAPEPAKTIINERFQKIADWRLFANAGTSEGARAGWETRHGAAGAASAVAELQSKRAEESGSVHDHVEAMKAHEDAAGKWAAVGTAEAQDRMADHLGKEQMHRTKAAELAREGMEKDLEGGKTGMSDRERRGEYGHGENPSVTKANKDLGKQISGDVPITTEPSGKESPHTHMGKSDLSPGEHY